MSEKYTRKENNSASSIVIMLFSIAANKLAA